MKRKKKDTQRKNHTQLAKQHTWNWKEHNVVRSFVLINATVKSQLIYRRTAEIHGIPMLPFVYHQIQVYAYACTCKSVRVCVCERQYTCTFRCCSLLSHTNVYFISDIPNEWAEQTNERTNGRTFKRISKWLRVVASLHHTQFGFSHFIPYRTIRIRLSRFLNDSETFFVWNFEKWIKVNFFYFFFNRIALLLDFFLN